MNDPVWVPLLLSLKVAGWATAISALSGTAVGFGLRAGVRRRASWSIPS